MPKDDETTPRQNRKIASSDLLQCRKTPSISPRLKDAKRSFELGTKFLNFQERVARPCPQR